MNMSNNTDTSEIAEIDCYEKILKFFHKRHHNRDKTEIWKNQSLIQLMKKLQKTKDKRTIRNALILLISLFEQIPPDIYNNRGININRLSEDDRRMVQDALKKEFIAN